MSSGEAQHVLDNSAWHALTTLHSHLAIGTGLAKRYPADIVGLGALVDASDAALNDLAQIVEPGESVVLISTINLPVDVPGWTVHDRFSPVQMVCDEPAAQIASDEEIAVLTQADIPEIRLIIQITHSVPFEQRTLELGHYVGIRRDGHLISMAGERSCLPGYREISSVCTHPDYWGRGYAGLLVNHLVAQNWQRGDVSFLYVAPSNTRARSLYERLNFRKRRDVHGFRTSH